MPMKPKEKIEWTETTWNPVTGCYGPDGTAERPNFCPECYALRISKMRGWRFVPAFHPHRLKQVTPGQRPRFIFVCSMADLFGAWVPRTWIEQVLAATQRAPQHVYQFLTKNPERLAEFNPWPENCWVGATATDQTMTEQALRGLAEVKAPVRFISFEPLLADCTLAGAAASAGLSPEETWPLEWLIIGSLTGPKACQPHPAWVRRLTKEGDGRGLPIFYKANLISTKPRRDFPPRPLTTWQGPG
ncbi:MAG: DUF5131 family protein, partial [Planctomycetes bacterium]|nr:DUF5131 family protein [Planctomycetota bacterium]